MDVKDKTKESNLLQRIANHQMMFGSFISNQGLLRGKMGLVLYFFHYARFSNISLYDDFAGELLDDICETIHLDTPICFLDGLCGIGWGIEYLKWQGFIEGNTDEILEDIDRKVMERDPRRIIDNTFETGLDGIACYVLSRLSSPRIGKKPFDSLYLMELDNSCQSAFRTDKRKNCLWLMDFLHGELSENHFFDEWLKDIYGGEVNAEEQLSWKIGLKMLL